MQQRAIAVSDAVELFLIDAEARRLSRSTIRTYSVRLGKFTAWCADGGISSLQSITAHHIRLFQIHLQGYSAKFQHNVSGALRTFFNFCVAEQLLQQSPFANVRMPKLPHRILPSFSRADMDTLINHCKTERDHAIVLFLLDSGVRASELINLQLRHYDLHTGAVTVMAGKGEKDRTTHVGAKTRKQLARYFLRERSEMKPNDYVFVSDTTGEQLTVWGLMQIMTRLRKRTGIEHCTAHTFRRTFALECLRNGMNIHVLARLMGHNDIQVLRQYLDLAESDLAEQHSQHGPVDNL